MKTTFMNVSRGVIGALAFSLGISSCQSSQSKMTFEQEGDSLTVIHITNPTQYLLLPVEEKTPEAQVCIASDSVPVDMDVRLSREKVDYFVPFALPKGEKEVAVRIRHLPKEALCWKELKLSDTFDTTNTDQYRPLYHHTPLYGWMNDANGLVYKDGEYHLFYQYNPYGSMWGNMHWGHSVSKDLVHWEHLEPALARDTLGHIFSGSSVVDDANTAGYGAGAIVAFYTSASDKNGQIQCMAYSTDNGRTFTKYEKNPVLTPFDGLKDFRDPKVFWHEETKSYIMILWVDGNEFAILRSTDLEKWNISQRFELTDGFECPDLICLTDETGKHWFVTTADGYYYPGEFDGYSFNWSGKRYCLYMNKVPYAAQTYSNTDGRVIFVPWLRLEFKGRKYTGAMGIPRELGLIKIDNEYRITLKPVQEFKDEFKSQSFKVRDLTVFVDNGIVEVTADCDTMLGVYEV